MGILINENQIGGGGSNSSHNIGDIFYTTRTDNSLNGAVECNGSQYNFSDINGGDNNIQALLEAGKLPSVSIAEFDTMVAEQGGCDSWGIDTSYAYFRPTGTLYMIINPSSAPGLNDRDIKYPFYTDKECTQQAGTASVHNAIMATILSSSRETVVARLPIGDTTVSNVKYYCWEASPGIYYTVSEKPNIGDTIYIESSGSMTPSGNFSTINKIGYAINGINIGQIAYTPENNVIGTTYFKVPKKIGRVLVRTQKPTADNNYTWYNLYADGWVEQGGTVKGGFSQSTNWNYRNVSLPIEMIDNSYINTFQATWNFSYGGQVGQDKVYATTDSTATTMRWAYILFSSATTMFVNWQVSGYAAPSEYTKDKWNYQNVQVERPMIQLFNSTTDTAVATCNQVLADVSALNQGDYVIETQFPTAENNYSWYRLYKSGWVEQGGYVSYTGSWINGHIDSVVLPIEFANTDYRIMIGRTQPADGNVLTSYDTNKTTTGFDIWSYAVNQSTAVASNWFAVGMSAQGRK